MLTKITLVIAMCLAPKGSDVQGKLAELRRTNPNATVTLRVDNKAKCANGHLVTKTKKEDAILAALKN